MIRNAVLADLPAIQSIYALARAFMRKSGNLKQWSNGYPDDQLLMDDISKKQLFVLEEEGAPHAVFAFILGEDPTYQVIENGAWPNHKPYGTIHRIGSDQTRRGVLSKALDFALQFTDEVRADTHEDNKPMQHTLAKNGFIRCGIIYLENGDPRIAYQYSKEQGSHENL